MTLNQSNRKKLAAALAQTGRNKLSDEQVEAAAMVFIEGKKDLHELAEKYGVTPQTLRQRMKQLTEVYDANGTAAAAKEAQ